MRNRLSRDDIPPHLWASATGDWGDQDPLLPLPGYFPDDPDRWFATHHAQCAAPARDKARVVLIGDSITENWTAPPQAALWQRTFAPLPTHVLAIGGDRTQQILWRFQHGALDGIDPDLVVLLAGVNNLWTMRQDDSRVARALASVVQAIRARLPRARVLHLAILPTQATAAHPIRRAARRVNALVAPFSRAAGAEFVDGAPAFLGPEGTLSAALMPDYVHLSPLGYGKFAEFLRPYLPTSRARS